METVKELARQEAAPLGKHAGLKLALLRRLAKDLGAVILQPDSPHLISGVEIEAGTFYPDDRGFFSELFRVGASRLTAELAGCPTLQVSVATSYPGIIKALHYHFEQTDFWAPITGMFQVVLCDLREGSPTHGQVNTLYVGSLRPWRIKIPPGVGHGYKITGTETATLVYLTDRFYNPKDEGRLAYNHSFLNYDWELQCK
ncbi:MAG TPA: dTDP-4-dehydrorhamnose 3,5-epimerase family protein [Terriglobia bacterium]|nr:dTDP-4-dehydrorhamnose 3,5-epimerase family protein [Terriglobia bacterium]